MAKKKRKGERPDGLIQVALDVGHWPDGRRKRKYFYGHTRAEANAKKLAYKTYVQNGSIDREKITVGEWVTIFKDTYRENIDEAYLKGDDVPYDRLIAALGDMRMKVVTESDLQAALNTKIKPCIIESRQPSARRNLFDIIQARMPNRIQAFLHLP